MSTHDGRYFDLCAARVLGCLDESDRFDLEAHLAPGCTECEAEMLELGAGAVLLAASAGPVSPPPAVRELLLERVRADFEAHGAPGALGPRRERRPRGADRPRGFAWSWAAAAAIVVVLAVSSYTAFRYGERLRGELADTRDRVAALTRELDDARRWASLLDSGEARVVSLAPTGADTTGLTGRLIYDASSGRAVATLINAKVRPGSDYELWAIRGGAPASLGLVRADASGRFVLRLPDAGPAEGLAAFAVSLEHEGGSPNPHAPSGPVVLLGKIGG